jgi:hypothetical protein
MSTPLTTALDRVTAGRVARRSRRITAGTPRHGITGRETGPSPGSTLRPPRVY